MFFASLIASSIIPITPTLFHLILHWATKTPSSYNNSPCDGYYSSPITFHALIEPWRISGQFSFAVAKSIDIAWDIFVGRGGQAIMVLICYRVFLSGLVHVMESSPVSYDLYTALVFSGPSFATTMLLVKRIFTSGRYWARMAWLLFSTIYIMLFPTLMGAMTGYVASREAVIVLRNGITIPYGEFFGYLHLGSENGTMMALIDGSEYGPDYVDNSTCITQTKDNVYGYGFSDTVWLFVCMVHGIWTLGTYGLWVDSNRKSQLNQAGRRVGTYRAIIDLGEVLAQDLGTTTCAYPEGKLKKALSKKSQGLKYYQSSSGSTSYIGLSSRGHGDTIDIDSLENSFFGSKESSGATASGREVAQVVSGNEGLLGV